MVFETPTLYEWVALIQQNAEQSHQLSAFLRVESRNQGVAAEPSLIMSIKYYEQAIQLLSIKTMDSKQDLQIAYLTRIGQAMLKPYPRYDDWQFLIGEDPTFARDLCIALEIKRAVIGPHSPHDLVESIAVYHLIISK